MYFWNYPNRLLRVMFAKDNIVLDWSLAMVTVLLAVDVLKILLDIKVDKGIFLRDRELDDGCLGARGLADLEVFDLISYAFKVTLVELVTGIVTTPLYSCFNSWLNCSISSNSCLISCLTFCSTFIFLCGFKRASLGLGGALFNCLALISNGGIALTVCKTEEEVPIIGAVRIDLRRLLLFAN